MNKIISSLVALMMMSLAVAAQPGGPRGEMMQERMESQRVAFITQKLQLTPDEAAKFWPIYNEYRDKQQQLRRSAMADRIEGGFPADMSDAEANNLIAKQFAMEENLLSLKREYYDKLKSAIPPRKIAQLNPIEMEFNRTVLEHIRDRMGDRN